MNHQQAPNKTFQNLHINFVQSDLDAVLGSFNTVSFSGKSPIIKDYEKVIAKWFGTDLALACANGTIAIELALRSLEVGPGDYVALPPTAPIMTILPIITIGATPVFCDVATGSFSADLDHLSDLRSRYPIKALIVVPMWGYPLSMEKTAQYCKKHNIALIEDCAHAIGTKADGKYLGLFGDVATFSTHERKLVSTGEGGFCLVRDEIVYEKMLSWQHHGLVASNRDRQYRLGEAVGTNFKLSPLCAALGINQFNRLAQKIAERRERVTAMREQLADLSDIKEFDRFQSAEVNGYSMVFRYLGGSCRSKAAQLAARGVISDTTRYGYKPLYKEPAFVEYAEPCPNAEQLIETIFTVPCHEGLSTDDMSIISTAVHDIFGRKDGAE
ncbi:DegT/DnrJ/EryC1/StrS family aminotransferase [Rhizobium sp. CFBP 8762]|uniref:DegT/DnrJ/EryC1/StrS family aminotransferase n=1 Tax=Rhizobium sp. CFBP 8762 TaxID=2775279 RepID=UPI00177C787C|nr:DegT/DnrJ/EryC1/StrS family aminotransferase [Rhizobium sp. CFBP 8762]MBD8555174.1 DegT/DnrJ/EryC1/StrS family aminotransferase [Rhizobium sp. CFBP 8762]